MSLLIDLIIGTAILEAGVYVSNEVLDVRKYVFVRFMFSDTRRCSECGKYFSKHESNGFCEECWGEDSTDELSTWV